MWEIFVQGDVGEVVVVEPGAFQTCIVPLEAQRLDDGLDGATQTPAVAGVQAGCGFGLVDGGELLFLGFVGLSARFDRRALGVVVDGQLRFAREGEQQPEIKFLIII